MIGLVHIYKEAAPKQQNASISISTWAYLVMRTNAVSVIHVTSPTPSEIKKI
jgi:hypothetical protein